MAIVTISREMGSGGKEAAVKVAEQLGCGCIDKELIVEVAREAGVPEEEVERYDERVVHPVKEWLRELLVEPWDAIVNPPQTVSLAEAGGLNVLVPGEEHVLDSEEYHDFLQMVITRLWRRGRGVILGRGAQCVLADHRYTLHVRLTAPFDIRCGRVMYRYGMSQDEASTLIRDEDKKRAQYLHKHYRADWADPTLYHMTFNTGMMSIDDTVGIIADSARRIIVAEENRQQNNG